MKVSDFDYVLPDELIAQVPAEKRDSSRLMVIDRESGKIEHRIFSDILDYLNEGDCIVLNDSRVIPARIFGKKADTDADVEFLLIKRLDGDIWQSMVRPGRRLKIGSKVHFGKRLTAEIMDYGEDGTRIVKFFYEGIFMERLSEIGQMPLPPYIERENTLEDAERYQTVYSKYDGSAAAPTAGLHFTDELLERIKSKGVDIAYVTLHVGIGTFRPVKVDDVKEHHMHFEEYNIPEDSVQKILRCKKKGKKIIAVGTTATRTIESSAYMEKGELRIAAGENKTDIFIYPGYKFKVIDRQITNFHLPKSTLLMLVSAFYDREKILEAYDNAIAEKYRFFSYGDAMFIL